MTVDGLAIRFGVKTASNDVNPSLLFVRQFTNAVSAELPRGPIKRSIWATSLPSPTSDSPTHNLSIFAIARLPKSMPNDRQHLATYRARRCTILVFSVRKGSFNLPHGPVGRIARTGISPQPNSIILTSRLQGAGGQA